MAHPCIDCDGECYCNGSISDAVDDLTPDDCTGCGCAEGDGHNAAWADLDDDDYEDAAIGPEDICRECGCHNAMACFHPDHGPCWWVESATDDGDIFKGPLCSHCAMKLENVERPWQTSS